MTYSLEHRPSGAFFYDHGLALFCFIWGCWGVGGCVRGDHVTGSYILNALPPWRTVSRFDTSETP